jgi:predicted dehydrogenase
MIGVPPPDISLASPRPTAQGALRFAVVGCGAAAERCHLAGLPYAAGVQLVALVDPVPAHARRLADAYALLAPAAPSPSMATSIAEIVGTVDLAVVTAPHSSHAELVIALANAGVHCLVEKPMALTVDECDRMDAAARDNHVVLGVAFVRRLFPASAWIKKMIADGALGDLLTIDWQEGSPYDWPLVSPSLFVPGLAGGGVVADGGSHILDLVLWWLEADAADHVAYRDTSLGGVEADATIELRVRGVDVAITLSRMRALRNTCIITGSAGTVEFGLDVTSRGVVRAADGTILEDETIAAVAPAQEEWELLFAEQLRNFGAAVKGAETVYAGARDGRRVTAVIERCYRERQEMPVPWRAVRAI